MNNRPPFGLIISTFSIALIAYLLAMVIVILGGISDTLGDVAEQVAGPDRFGADGIAEVTE